MTCFDRAEAARLLNSHYIFDTPDGLMALEAPLCVDCETAGRIELASDVHHVEKVRDYPELRLVEANCMALCGSCHSARTRRGE